MQPAQLKGFPRGTLTIERSRGRDTLRIWIADSEDRQQQGLMWVRDLPAGQAMIFPLPYPREMNMWMKNTYISLDMLFYGEGGRILHIIRRAKPLSEQIIPSGGEVHGVVELRAGEADRRGIAVGDRVSYSADAR